MFLELRKTVPFKVSGSDCIPGSVLKQCREDLSRSVSQLLSKTSRQARQLKLCNLASVIYVHKKSSKSATRNSRSISLLPSLSRVMRGFVNRSRMGFLDRNGIISINQYCFRQRLGTQYNLMLLHHRSSIVTAGVQLAYPYNDNLYTILPSFVYDIFSRKQIIVFSLHPFCSWMSSCCQYNYSLWKIIPSRSAIRRSEVWFVLYAPSIAEKLPATVCSEMADTPYFRRTVKFLGKGRYLHKLLWNAVRIFIINFIFKLMQAFKPFWNGQISWKPS